MLAYIHNSTVSDTKSVLLLYFARQIKIYSVLFFFFNHYQDAEGRAVINYSKLNFQQKDKKQ